MRKFNYQGDTQFLSGEVIGKREENGLHLVDLKMTMTNQRGVETSFGEATVALPSREHGPALLPAVPQDVERKTTQLWQRHLELTEQKRRAVK